MADVNDDIMSDEEYDDLVKNVFNAEYDQELEDFKNL